MVQNTTLAGEPFPALPTGYYWGTLGNRNHSNMYGIWKEAGGLVCLFVEHDERGIISVNGPEDEQFTSLADAAAVTLARYILDI